MGMHHHDDQQEAGWISLVDLLTVLVLIGACAAIGFLPPPNGSGDSTVAPTVSSPEDELEECRKDLAHWKEVAKDAQDRYAATLEELAVLEGKLRDAEASASQSAKALAEAQAALENARIAAADAQKQSANALAEAQAALAEAQAALEKTAGASAEAQKQWAKDVLNLSGELRHVVFVVDRSQSMARGGRWEDALSTVDRYIRYLPVSRTALVVFGSDVRTIPSNLNQIRNQQWESVELPEVTRESRDALLAELASLTPAGETRTRQALWRAMEFKEVDAIFLFTDGMPDAADGGIDPRESVLQLVRDWKVKNPKACIHTVGIGDYFNPAMRDFLLGVAKSTGGTFFGR